MAWLAVDSDSDIYIHIKKPERSKEIEPQLFYIKDIDGFVKNNTL